MGDEAVAVPLTPHEPLVVGRHQLAVDGADGVDVGGRVAVDEDGGAVEGVAAAVLARLDHAQDDGQLVPAGQCAHAVEVAI